MGCRSLEHRVDAYSVPEEAVRRPHQMARRGRRMQGGEGNTYSRLKHEGPGDEACDLEVAVTGVLDEGVKRRTGPRTASLSTGWGRQTSLGACYMLFWGQIRLSRRLVD